MDSNGAYQPSVVRATNGSYLMYYTGNDGSTNQILGAWSSDGYVWTKLPGEIFLNNGAGSPSVLAISGGYRMWFESVVWGLGPLGYTDRIYGATSPNGFNWTITGVVVDVGSGSAWDAATVADPYVLQTPDGTYRMYYSMYAANGSIAIGVATSSDLVTFTKWSGNPVLVPGAAGTWDSAAVAGPCVIAGTTWTLLYGGRQATTKGQVGFATSIDGYHFTRSPSLFLAHDTPGTWDSAAVGSPDFLEGSPARLYFDGNNGVAGSSTGAVNMTSSSGGNPGGPPGGGTTGTILGLPALFFAFLTTFVGVAVAVFVAFLISAGRGSRRPGE